MIRPAIFVWVGVIAYAAFFSWFTISRAHNFNAGWYDLGIMTQTVWRTGHGHGFTFTNPETGPGGAHGWTSPRTAIHADYLLLLLAPLSWFGHTAELLLIAQAAVLALGAWFLFRIARKLLGSPWIGALVAWVYLLYPPLHFANLFEFHAVTVSVTFILAAADAIVHGRHRWWWFWAGLALISKEQVGLTVGLVGFVLYWWRRERQRAFWALGIPWAWTALQVLLVIPLSRPSLPWSFVSEKFFETAGDNPTSLVKRLIDPRVWWERLPTKTHLHDLAQLLGPLGLIPLVSPWPLLAVPEMLLYWLSDSPDQQHIVHHYHALAIPLLFLGLIFGWRLIRRVGKWHPLRRWLPQKWLDALVIALLLLGTITATRAASIWPWSPVTRWPVVAWKERLAPAVEAAWRLVPPAAPVAITQNLGPQAAQRPTVYLLPSGLEAADYVVILNRQYDPAIPTNDKRLAEKAMIELFLDWVEGQPAWEMVFHRDRVYVFRRTGPSTKPEPAWPDHLLGR